MVRENQDFSKNSNLSPDPELIRRILTSHEGAALIRLLQRDGGAGVRTAAELLQKGDTEGAKAALTPLLNGTEGAALAERLGGKL